MSEKNNTPAPVVTTPAAVTPPVEAVTPPPAATPPPESKPAEVVSATPPADKEIVTPPVDAKAAQPEAKPDDAAAKPPESDPSKAPATPPEKYELKMPEGSEGHEFLVDHVSALAKAQGMTNEQAQQLLESNTAVAAHIHEHQMKHLQAKSSQWLDEAKADSTIGGQRFEETVAFAKHAIDKMFPGIPEVHEFLNMTGFGNKKEILKGFAEYGRAISNGKLAPLGTAKVPEQTRSFYDHPTSPK